MWPMTWSGLTISTSCAGSMSAAVTGPSPFFLSDRIASARLCRRNTTPLRLRRMSTTSSSTSRAWFGERFWTSTIRGLRNPDWGMFGPVCLLRVQLDDEAFVDRGRQIGAAGHGLERALQPLRIDLQPLEDAARH